MLPTKMHKYIQKMPNTDAQFLDAFFVVSTEKDEKGREEYLDS